MQNNLRALRKRKGYTLKTLSEKTGLSIGAIGNFETGARGISQDALEKVAAALSVTVADILHDCDSAPSAPQREEPGTSACLHCAAKDKEIEWLKKQVEGLVAALAEKPSHGAGRAYGAEDNKIHKARKEA